MLRELTASAAWLDEQGFYQEADSVMKILERHASTRLAAGQWAGAPPQKPSVIPTGADGKLDYSAASPTPHVDNASQYWNNKHFHNEPEIYIGSKEFFDLFSKPTVDPVSGETKPGVKPGLERNFNNIASLLRSLGIYKPLPILNKDGISNYKLLGYHMGKKIYVPKVRNRKPFEKDENNLIKCDDNGYPIESLKRDNNGNVIVDSFGRSFPDYDNAVYVKGQNINYNWPVEDLARCFYTQDNLDQRENDTNTYWNNLTDGGKRAGTFRAMYASFNDPDYERDPETGEYKLDERGEKIPVSGEIERRMEPRDFQYIPELHRILHNAYIQKWQENGKKPRQGEFHKYRMPMFDAEKIKDILVFNRNPGIELTETNPTLKKFYESLVDKDTGKPKPLVTQFGYAFLNLQPYNIQAIMRAPVPVDASGKKIRRKYIKFLQDPNQEGVWGDPPDAVAAPVVAPAAPAAPAPVPAAAVAPTRKRRTVDELTRNENV